MKQPGVPPISVPIEELEGLLEQARPALSAEGYQKLRAAIRTLVYVTELLEQKETTLAALRELLCPAAPRKRQGAAAGRCPDGRAGPGKRLAEAEACGGRAWAQWRRRVSRGAEGPRSARFVKAGTHVRMGAAARSIRSVIPACWCGSKGRRPWPRPSMSWKSCAAICAGTCTRPPLRRGRREEVR